MNKADKKMQLFNDILKKTEGKFDVVSVAAVKYVRSQSASDIVLLEHKIWQLFPDRWINNNKENIHRAIKYIRILKPIYEASESYIHAYESR